ncbi:metallophosphoesterase [Draconibacterium sp. IB214405]|uniref:metallophosphoesterase family protein n=1 Tax=Draconibacterium sp. IB214405 TaxID=3097352 RepID=UPI002A16651C|nr:metallophosphoesterase [Draconibacterium sp. IB214405]MDX8339979.1 metallophosphoesterase [Draconibacterium sp. IB214405]
MKHLIYLSVSIFLLFSCTQSSKPQQESETEDFSFVFMTDIHITEERQATEGFSQAIDTINSLNPDFVLTGGDNIMDALAVSYEASDSAYNLYENTIKQVNAPVYTTMGNHEVFGLYERSGVSPSHEEYGKKLYENRLAKRYYSFDYKDWHFVVLDGIGFTEDRHYYGHVDEEQLVWLKKDLEAAGDKPIAVSIHIPLLSIGSQIMQSPTQGMDAGSIVTNANEVREILEQHNTKLVLQGHLHFLEDIEYNGIHYITGGAVSSQWWQGQRFGMEEGFLKIDVKGEDFSWKYVDFGWEVKEAS